jgi:SAM-dependent methyltransferase
MNQNAVLAHVGRTSLRLVRDALSHSNRVLDIGSGTGREAIEMARSGKRVVACDPSEESLRILRRKAEEQGLSELITTVPCAASGIDPLLARFGAHSFDGAYSSFALSYEPSLEPIPEKVWSVLMPGSPFLCSIYNRLCLAEVLLFAPFLVPRRAFRRLEGKTVLPVDRFQVVVRSYTRTEVVSQFEPRFILERAWAIPCVVPPNYLSILLERAGPLRPAWEALDLHLNGRWPFRHLGSHTAYLFRARERTATREG